MTRHVIGLFPSQAEADRALELLERAGIDRGRIGVALMDREQERVVASQLGSHPNWKAAGQEAAKYSALGGVAGVIAGVAALAIPGVGPVLAAGPLAAALPALIGGGMGAFSGALAGLQGLAVQDDDLKLYAEGLRNGGVLISCQAPDAEVAEVTRLFREAGAQDLDVQRRGVADVEQFNETPAG